MGHKAETRLAKLQNIASQLHQSKPVAKRTLETWLENDYKLIEEEWQQQQALRRELKNKPAAVMQYEKLLQKANFWEARAQAASRNKQKSAAALRSRADNAFERALEFLEEAASADYGLCEWFDRELDFTATGALQACAGAVPLPVTSRSADRQGLGILGNMRTKREITLFVVEHVIRELERQLERTEDEILEEDRRDKAHFGALIERSLDEKFLASKISA